MISCQTPNTLLLTHTTSTTWQYITFLFSFFFSAFDILWYLGVKSIRNHFYIKKNWRQNRNPWQFRLENEGGEKEPFERCGPYQHAPDMFLCACLCVCILDSTIIHCVCECLRGSLPYMRQSERKNKSDRVMVGEERESRSDRGARRPPLQTLVNEWPELHAVFVHSRDKWL